MPDVVRIGTHGASNDCTPGRARRRAAHAPRHRRRRGAAAARLKQRRPELLERQQSLGAGRSQLASKQEQCGEAPRAAARPNRHVARRRREWRRAAQAAARRTRSSTTSAGRILQAHDQAAAAAADAHVLSCLKRPAPNTPEGERRRMAREETDALEAAVLSRARGIVSTTMSSVPAMRLAALEGGFEDGGLRRGEHRRASCPPRPLQYHVHLAVLVGEPQEGRHHPLAARQARRPRPFLFERLQRAAPPDGSCSRTQYRMHPAIRRFASAHADGGVLRDGDRRARVPRAARRGGSPAWSGGAKIRASPRSVLFFNLRGAQRRDEVPLVPNEAEAWLCCRLVGALRKPSQERYLRRVAAETAGKRAAYELGCSRGHERAWGALCGRVAVLTPYNGQVRLLERVFVDEFGESARTAVTFSNVDVFRGASRRRRVLGRRRSAAGLTRARATRCIADARRPQRAPCTRARRALARTSSIFDGRASAPPTTGAPRRRGSSSTTRGAARRRARRPQRSSATRTARGGGDAVPTASSARIPRRRRARRPARDFPWNAFAPAPAAGLARCASRARALLAQAGGAPRWSYQRGCRYR